MATQPSKIPGDTLHAQLFSGIAALLVLLLGLLFVTYGLYERKATLANGEKAAQQIADQTALVSESAIESSRQLLSAMEFLARPPAAGLQPEHASTREALLKLKTRHPHIMDLLIVSADGRIVNWTGDGTPPDIRDREYYTFHARQGNTGLYLGRPLLSKVHHGQWFFALSEALRDEQGRLQQVLVAIIDVALLHRQLQRAPAIASSTQVLLAHDGTIYTRTPDHAQFVGKRVGSTQEVEMLSPEKPTVTVLRTSLLDHKQRIITFRRISYYPLVAAGSILVDELMAAWQLRMGLLGGLWLLLSATIVWVTRYANALSQAQARLATLDGLTGIQNRRAIMNTASRLKRSQEHAGSLALMMIDADHFKDINDRYGHLAGDEVLRRLSEVLRTQIRTTDIVGRYGGEEFLVLMPDTGPDGALTLAEKLRQAVANSITTPQPLTISIGVATTSASDASLDQALTRADDALYRAKAAGRNCVRAAE